MALRSKTCTHDNCTNPVWSKGLCKNHTKKKPLVVRAKILGRKKINPINLERKIKKETRHNFFLKIWYARPHRSEISKERLGKEPLSIYFHHILPKSKYPEAELDEENIILMTGDEHNNVENDMYKYDEVNKRREMLLRKYDII